MPKSTLAQDIASEANGLLGILRGSDHGVLRGTMEAVLVESQGGQLIGPDGPTRHVENLDNALGGLRRAEIALHNRLSEVGDFNHRAAALLSNALRPLRRFARRRADLMQQVMDLGRELRLLHPEQLSQAPLLTGERASSLVSRQLNVLGGVQAGLPLVPRGLSDHPWVRDTLDEVRRLPVTPVQATDEARALAMAVRTALLPSVQLGGSPIQEAFGPTAEQLLRIGGGLMTLGG